MMMPMEGLDLHLVVVANLSYIDLRLLDLNKNKNALINSALA